MTGGPDPLYVGARRALLDALEALGPQLEAVVLVGAQAVYLHTGDGELEVAPHTTDADLALSPTDLRDQPLLNELLGNAEFVVSRGQPGVWLKRVEIGTAAHDIQVDLLVPASLGGAGRRAARIPPHDRRVARKVHGLEGALVDRDFHPIGALETADTRVVHVAVAGPAALLVAKLIKLGERTGDPDRLVDKDALDVFRLLQSIPTDELATRFRRLEKDSLSETVTAEARAWLVELFTDESSDGALMAARAAGPGADPAVITGSAAILANDLLQALANERP